jgi:hypothetical protein
LLCAPFEKPKITKTDSECSDSIPFNTFRRLIFMLCSGSDIIDPFKLKRAIKSYCSTPGTGNCWFYLPGCSTSQLTVRGMIRAPKIPVRFSKPHFPY